MTKERGRRGLVGYVETSNENPTFSCFTATVIFADDFSLENLGCGKEIYLVGRNGQGYEKIFSNTDESFPHYDLFSELSFVLKSEEAKHLCSCRVWWKLTNDERVEVLKTEITDSAWLPVEMLNSTDDGPFINVGGILFDSSPSPLEISSVCYALNLLAERLDFLPLHPFYNCINSIFCSVSIVSPLMKLLGDDFPFSHKPFEEYSFIYKRQTTGKISCKKIESALSVKDFPETMYKGNISDFITYAKREYIMRVYSSFSEAVRKKNKWSGFYREFKVHTNDFLEKILSVSNEFVVLKNVNSINDLKYFTLYELHSASVFYDERLSMHKSVRKARERVRVFNKFKIPDAVFSKNDYI